MTRSWTVPLFGVNTRSQVQRCKCTGLVVFYGDIECTASFTVGLGGIGPHVNALERNRPNTCNENHSAKNDQKQVPCAKKRELVVVYETIDN